MKRKRIIIISALIVLVSAVIGYKLVAKKGAAVTFETSKVERGNIYNTVTATGTIEATTTVQVGTQVSGIIRDVYVDFNDNVKKGQLLAKLDETALRAQYEQSRAQLDQAQAQLNFQKATYDRMKVLYDKNLIAQSDYDQALYNYENARASLSNASSNLSKAKVSLDYATITSPIAGVVLNRAVEAGQTVAASFNTPTLFTIVNDLTQMEVHTSVDEADIGKVEKDQRVEFTVDAYPDMKFEGKVSEVRLQPVTTNNVVTYVVMLSAPNPDKKLMPGMTASATIYVDEKDNTLILTGKALRFAPDKEYLKKIFAERKSGMSGRNDARAEGSAERTFPSQGAGAHDGSAGKTLRSGEKKKTVWIRNDRGGIHPVRVETGIDNGSDVEILSGLSEGDEVIISMNNPDEKPITPVKSTGARRGPFPFGG